MNIIRIILGITILYLILYLMGCEPPAMAYSHSHTRRGASTHYKKYGIKSPKSWSYGTQKANRYVPIQVGD